MFNECGRSKGIHSSLKAGESSTAFILTAHCSVPFIWAIRWPFHLDDKIINQAASCALLCSVGINSG